MREVFKRTANPPMTGLTVIRSALGLTKREVAERVGVSDQAVVSWERGWTRPTPYARGKLARVLGVSERVLFLDADEIIERLEREDRQ